MPPPTIAHAISAHSSEGDRPFQAKATTCSS
jgi:hypothetical protein